MAAFGDIPVQPGWLKHGKPRLYIDKRADVDVDILAELIQVRSRPAVWEAASAPHQLPRLRKPSKPVAVSIHISNGRKWQVIEDSRDPIGRGHVEHTPAGCCGGRFVTVKPQLPFWMSN